MSMSGERDRVAHALGERIKELALVHTVAGLVATGRAPDLALLEELVALIPPAWQYPAICEARIRWGALEVQTPGWRETPWTQRATFAAAGTEGSIEVAYREAPEGEPFLHEEASLLESLARILGASFGRAHAERLSRERQERLTFLQELGDATRGAETVEAILPVVMERLGRHLRASRCAVAHVDPDGKRCVIPYDYTDGCKSFVGVYALTAFGTEVLAAASAPVVVRDVAAEFPPEAAAKNAALGVAAMIVCSSVKDGALRSLLAVQQTTPRDWTEHEVLLVTETAARTWAAMDQRRAEERLRQNESLLRVASEAMRLGGWSVEVTDRNVTWSDEMCAIHDLPPGSKPTADEALAFLAPEYREATRRAIGACVASGTPFDVEAEIVTAKNRRAWVRWFGRAERDAKGAVVRVTGACQDVTDRHRLEDHVRHTQKMEGIGHLAAGVAHDFNNILSVILSYTALTLAELRPGSPLRADIEEIQTAGRHATELTRQLLTFSRQQAMQPRQVAVHSIVRGMEKILARLVGAGISFTVLAEPPWGEAFVDPAQLEQVLMNLVINARDATPKGGSITIEVWNETLDTQYVAMQHGVVPGPYVVLTVRDTGCGMDAATRERIFEPFFTTKEVGKGTGLGLATVHGIVTQSGGHVSVDSEVGVGTTFKVYLPRRDGVESAAEPEPQRWLGAVGGSETILLLEDSLELRVTIRSTLRRAGYEVLEAENAGDAFLVAEAHRGTIHLLLTDVVLPRLSGREVAARLAKTRPDMRALYIYGHTHGGTEQHQALPEGAPFLHKPLTPESLLAKVREVLDATHEQSVAGHGERVLLVDDEEALLFLAKRVLKRLGYEVSGFTDPAEAIRTFQARPSDFDAVVTDVSMGAMNGFDVVRAVWKAQPGFPVVVTSGYFRHDDLREADALGLTSLVVKPDTVEELGRVLHEALRGWREKRPG